jgi:truncated hemoglobin YjbI
MKIDVKRYAAEMLFHAAVGAPWDVSEAEFVAIVAMLNDGTRLTMQERTDVLAFFQTACENAAQVDPKAADALSVHRAACEAARRRGIKIRICSPIF